MPAEVEQMAYVREVPWHGLGVKVEEKMSAKEALHLGGLDWKVAKEPVYVAAKGGTFVEVPDKFAIQRSTDKSVLGIVGAPYQPLQNVEAFEFADALVDSGEAKYETAGALRGGRWVFLAMKVPKEMKVAGKDPIDLYLVVWNSHDGTKSITVMVTPVRPVCTNTLQIGLKQAHARWSVRHTGALEGKLAEARRSLELTFEYADEFVLEMDKLAQKSITDAKFEELVKQLTDVEKTADGLKNAWMTGRHERSSAYDAFNAIGEYYDWLRVPRSVNAQVMGTWFGEGMKMRQRAYDLLAA